MSSPAATLISATGNVHVERGGQRVSLAVGDPVQPTDTVVTDSGTTAVLRFTDGATARLSPDTRLDVREYSFGEGDPSFVLNLAQGAMRSVSGEVVKQNPDAFKITTPQATVGIRGTELFNAVVGGKEMHAVVFIDKGHIVVVTASDGRSVTMNNAMQSVQMTAGDGTPLMVQTFSLDQMQEIIRSLAPTLADNLSPGDGPGGPGDDEQGTVAATASSVVLVAMDSATAESVAKMETSLGGAGFDVNVMGGAELVSQLDGDVEEGSLDNAWTLVNQLFTEVPGSGEPGSEGGLASGSQYLMREFPGGIASGSAAGIQHLLDGTDPATAQEFVITGGVAGPLVGNALVVSGAQPFTLDDAPVVPISQTAGDVFNVDSLLSGAPDATYDIASGIYGDAVQFSVSDAPLTFGNDTINVGSMSGGYIYGDVQTGVIMGQSVVFGSDHITAMGTAINGSIVGDVQSVEMMGGELFFGNDVIRAGTMNSGLIVGDAAMVGIDESMGGGQVVFGSDTIHIDKISSSAVNVFGDVQNISNGSPNSVSITYGADVITVTEMEDGSVFGDVGTLTDSAVGGKDRITITSMSGGTVCGDAITIGQYSKGGDDLIAITEMQMGTVFGDGSALMNGAMGGNDTISITSMSGGAVYGDALTNENGAIGGNNSIIVKSMSGGALYGGVGVDNFAVTLTAGANITIGNFDQNTVDGRDSITLGGVGLGGPLSKSLNSGTLTLTFAESTVVNIVGVSGSDGDDAYNSIVSQIAYSG